MEQNRERRQLSRGNARQEDTRVSEKKSPRSAGGKIAGVEGRVGRDFFQNSSERRAAASLLQATNSVAATRARALERTFPGMLVDHGSFNWSPLVSFNSDTDCAHGRALVQF